MKPHLKEYAYQSIIEFIKCQTEQKDYAVIGLSGGIDSAVVSKLCCDALGPERVFNVIMPSGVSSAEDINDAQDLCNKFGMSYTMIHLDTITSAFTQVLNAENPILKGNIMARSRMIILYNYAHSMNGLVIGTGNKSELLTGYFTKYGDGGVDISPIAEEDTVSFLHRTFFVLFSISFRILRNSLVVLIFSSVIILKVNVV